MNDEQRILMLGYDEYDCDALTDERLVNWREANEYVTDVIDYDALDYDA